jgi:monoterpene epsilon-lactone hydrolase
MSQDQMDIVTTLLRNGPLDLGGDVDKQRIIYRDMLTAAPVGADVGISKADLGGIPAIRLEITDAAPTGTVLAFHGGCYALGSAETSVNLLAEVARRTSTQILSVDYRLAPEHPYPAAVNDGLTAYRALIDNGTDPASIALLGESAGAGLAMATMLAARDADLPQPSCAVLLSPWVDLTQSGITIETNAKVDPTMTGTALQIRADGYLNGADPSHRLVSPVFADLRTLAPILIQVGGHEVLLDDALRLAAKAANNNLDVTLDVVAGAPHVFQAFAAILPQGATALDRAATYLHNQLDRTT